MAIRTTAAAGNWSAGATWIDGVPPGVGDQAVINHAVVVDVNTIVGTSTATDSLVWAIDISVTGLVTVAAGVTLTVRGDIRQVGNNVVRDFTLAAGASLLFDTSLAAAPTTTSYKFQCGSAASQLIRLVTNGTAGSRCSISQNGAGGFRVTAADIFCIGLRFNHTTVTRGGNATTRMVPAWLGNDPAHAIYFDHVIFDGCGQIIGAQAGDVGFTLQNCTWRNSHTGIYNLTLAGNSTTAPRIVTGCVFDRETQFQAGPNWQFSDCYFLIRPEILGFSGSGQADHVQQYERIFAMVPAGSGSVSIPGKLKDAYVVAPADNQTNAHLMGSLFSGTQVVDGLILHVDGVPVEPDGFPMPAPSVATRIDFRNCITLPAHAGNQFSCSLGSWLGGANITSTVEHCTMAVSHLGGIYLGETVAAFNGMITSFRSNIAWAPGGTNAGWAIGRGAAFGTATDPVTAASCTHNGKHNLATGAAGVGYEIPSGSALGTNDVVTDPQFVDPTRNIARWDASLGGPGTLANAVAEMAKRNDPAGYNPAYNLVDLLAWVRAGFAPQNQALATAAHDGTFIGAVAVASTTAKAPRPLVVTRQALHRASRW